MSVSACVPPCRIISLKAERRDRDADGTDKFLHDAREACRAREPRFRDVGERNRIEAGELQRARQTADEKDAVISSAGVAAVNSAGKAEKTRR